MCSHFFTSAQCRIPYCYTYRLLYAGATQGELPEGQERVPWGIPVLRNSLTRYTARHLRIRRLIQFIFAGAVYCNAQEVWSALLCRPLRRVADMCSRKVSDTANMQIHKRTQCVSAEEKLLCRSPASQRSHVSNLRQTLKGKGRFTRGWKPQVSTLLCARAASAQFRSPRRRKTIVYQKIIEYIKES